MIQNTLQKILDVFPEQKDKTLIQNAFDMAQNAHLNQKRSSGEPYIIHPLNTAFELSEMKMDTSTIVAALLHDIVDDTPVTLEEIEKKFGKEVAFLVGGVSKLGRIKYRGVERHAENLRKMLVATAQDIRVIIIKFADRLHNMKTLSALPERKQKRIALETLEIYAPIADRLGISRLGKQLEDLAFPYIYPEEYEYVKRESTDRIKNANHYIKKLPPIILKTLKKEKMIPLSIDTRVKHYYSLWKKLEKYEHNWESVNDLIALRIVVKTIEDCYKTLGIIHQLWKPVPGKMKDYIALPKPNGYQSLHTTIFALGGKRIEIQIRTPQMNEAAEFGIAAHWRYKNKSEQSEKTLSKTFQWVEKLQEWKKDMVNSEDFIDSLKIDVFGDRIFVFTPKGDVIDLPSGATPVDFAYTIHSDVGDKCAGARVHGKMVALNTELHNGDIVEIITTKSKTPSQTWLSFVKTSHTRTHIKHWFRKQGEEKNIENGLSMINDELKALEGKTWAQIDESKKEKTIQKLNFKDEDALLAAIGLGDISINRIVQNITEYEHKQKEVNKKTKKSPTAKAGSVVIAGASGLQTHIAKCCNPKYPQAVVAYITVDKGASIHKNNCEDLKLFKKDDKILPAYWRQDGGIDYITIKIKTIDRVGMIQDVSRVMAELNINIHTLTATSGNKNKKNRGEENVQIIAEIEITDSAKLKRLIEKLKAVDGVREIERIQKTDR